MLGRVQLSVPLAVEKVLFRLALRDGGHVTLARAFLELPFSLEEVETAADAFADGVSVVKNEWGEFLSYEFPEMQKAEQAFTATDCPVCGGPPPATPTEGGVEVRAPIVCDSCYRGLRVARARPDTGALTKVKALFGKGEEPEDPVKAAKLEHEIFFFAMSLKVEQFTHTMLAAHSRHPSTELKARLDRMAGRRFVHVGLLPSGDAVGYRLPPGLSYPRPLYNRIAEPTGSTGRARALDLDVEPKGEAAKPKVEVRPPPKPKLNITVTPKERRRPR